MWSLRTLCALPVMLLAALPAAADPVADFYAGKQITLLIGTTTGGGYDLYGRMLARHIGRHIPGTPEVIVKNMPGADGLLLTNYIYNKGARDGTEIAGVQNGVAFDKLLQNLS